MLVYAPGGRATLFLVHHRIPGKPPEPGRRGPGDLGSRSQQGSPPSASEPCHKPNGRAGAAVVGTIQAAKHRLQRSPIDASGQAVQFLAWIKDHLQAPAEHGLGIGHCAGDRFHKNPPFFEGEPLLSGGFYSRKFREGLMELEIWDFWAEYLIESLYSHLKTTTKNQIKHCSIIQRPGFCLTIFFLQINRSNTVAATDNGTGINVTYVHE